MMQFSKVSGSPVTLTKSTKESRHTIIEQLLTPENGYFRVADLVQLLTAAPTLHCCGSVMQHGAFKKLLFLSGLFIVDVYWAIAKTAVNSWRTNPVNLVHRV